MRAFARILAALGIVFALSSTASAQIAPGKGRVHSIWSMDALLLADPVTCTSYKEFFSSSCAMSWKQAPPVDALTPAWSHFFNASVLPVAPIELAYEFRLVGVNWSDADEINGTWMVLRNGVVLTKSCRGKAYGLDQAPGGSNYFKLVCSDPSVPAVCAAVPEWHFIGYITERYDY
jgi:hypothetical protein